jgi:hypothetical protein
MRFFLLFLIVTSVSVLSEPIADFAPDQVGNVWKYQVDNLNREDFNYNDNSHFTKTFKLIKSEPIQDYIRIIFDVIDSGIDSEFNYGPINQISAIQNHYYDTLQLGDQTTFSSSNPTGFLPLFKTHLIDSKNSGITKLLFKNDSLFQFDSIGFSPYPYNYRLKYLQNIGLDSLFEGWSGGMTGWEFYVALISYSITPTSITQSPKIFNPVQATRQNVPSPYIFDLQGRRFQQRCLSALPPGLMINRGASYLQVK